jgi:uncharacterized protein YjiS (DUF1127 family)
MHTSIARSTAHCSASPGLLRRLVDHAVARTAWRRSIDQLSRLDDRLLRDVGLTRADVWDLTGRRC